MKKYLTWILVGMLLICYPSIALAKLAPGDFIDISRHWAEQDIQAVCNLGIMSGIGTTQQGFKIFSPESTVTRAQLAVTLQRTFQLDYGKIRFFKQPLATDYYPDVDNQTWYAEAVVMCSINQIFDYEGSFNAQTPVTRKEVALAVYRSFKAKELNVPMIMIMPIYDDTQNLTQEEVNAITFVSNTGIMKGDGHSFQPNQALKRAELAKILNRCSSLMVVDEGANGSDYPVKVGQTFTLSLAGNSTTGYVWNLNESYDKTLISLSGRNYQTEGSVNLVGQGGREYFKFQALKPGSTEINLIYARPWESVQPQRQFKLKVIISEAGSNSALKMDIKQVQDKSEFINIDLNLPQISGLGNESVQAALNNHFVQEANDLQSSLTKEAKDFKKECEQDGYPFRPYELVSRCSEYFENADMISFYVDYYYYSGGAHGATDRQPYNYDLSSGQELSLKDLFKDGYDYKAIINEEIRNEISSNPDNFFKDEMGFKGISDKQSYYIENNNLVIYFAQYEIAPYASGIPEFRIPLDHFALDKYRISLL